MGDVVVGIFAVLGLAFVVWLKVVRPIRGDVEWSRQGKRVEEAKRRRLERHAGRPSLP